MMMRPIATCTAGDADLGPHRPQPRSTAFSVDHSAATTYSALR
jgi:hypothetical protein